jgi:periplasmic protein TonB
MKALYLFLFINLLSALTSAQTPIECSEIKNLINNALKESKASRISIHYVKRKFDIFYERDTLSNFHFAYKFYAEHFLGYSLIKKNGYSYFTRDGKMWKNEFPNSLNYTGWIDSCQQSLGIFAKSLKSCNTLPIKTVTGMKYDIYEANTDKGSYDLWVNHDTKKLYKIEGMTMEDSVKLALYYNLPIQVNDPTELNEKQLSVFGFSPPLYLDNENLDGTEPVYLATDKRVEYKDGFGALYENLSKTIKMPKNDLRKGGSVNTLVSFVIEKDGSISNIKIRSKVSKALEREILSFFNLTNKDWRPAIYNKLKVRSYLTLPLSRRESPFEEPSFILNSPGIISGRRLMTY